nr:helix-turn-helix transcriptional regulator [Maliibacterium massiliense]
MSKPSSCTNLKALMEARALDLPTLHMRTGIPLATLKRIYCGRARRIMNWHLAALCTVLECGIGELLNVPPAQAPPE